ncbi:hypothetical protein [Aureimonas populi]|uniref:Glycosyltransferase n=1 Tax=Aureimonas populi TaxID=1701758 RepID=A0ABW5CI73_9HYPH|nr:hypothetical protein [Aureimonas populi]
MTQDRPSRCFLCRSREIAPTDRRLAYPGGRERRFPLACTSCGLLLEPEAGSEVPVSLAADLCAERFAPGPHEPFGLDIYTLRMAATLFGRRAAPADAAQRAALRNPHGALAASAVLSDLADMPPAPVSLGMMCRAGEVEAILASLPQSAAFARDVVLLSESGTAGPLTVEGFPSGAVRLATRPLAGDFGAQRNALQALCRQRWVLQLDADETLDGKTAALLPGLARMAEEDEAVSIGLPRRNLVGGVLSDVYPDVQYRLNRREVPYAGKVHERPVRHWRQSFIALHGAIDHHLSAEHVARRSQGYEALDPGHGRLEEAQALLRPYRG